tara:strand:- start:473 stop:1336 length:864 start_codon:yes stop_codon:yes gene_type:complete
MHQNLNKSTKKHFTQQEISFLTQNYLQGSVYCANVLNRSVKSIQNKCFRLNLKSTSESRKKPRYKTPDNYAVNPNVFINPTTPEACYILGLLWADGSINNSTRNTRSIILSTTFPDSTVFYKIFLKTGSWRIFQKQYKPNWKPSVIISTNNRLLTDHLITHSYKTKNQSACSILSTIPNHLKHYWFRGVFDGDGCITVNKAGSWRVCLSGPYEQDWKYIKSLFSELKIKFVSKQATSNKGHKSSHVRICKKTEIVVFMDYIYQNANEDGLCLLRKYEKYQQMKKMIN